MFVSIAAFAQTDIASFNGKTPQQIKSVYGASMYEDDGGYSDCYVLKYDTFSIAIDPDTMRTREFITNSSKFYFLMDIVQGGVKVGDSISKLYNINTQYTQNKPGNMLKTPKMQIKIKNHDANFVIFEERVGRFYFYVENSIIKEIGYFEID